MGQLLYFLKKQYFYFTLSTAAILGVSSANFFSTSFATFLDKGPVLIKKSDPIRRKDLYRASFEKFTTLLSGALFRDSEEAGLEQTPGNSSVDDYILIGTVAGDWMNSSATIESKSEKSTHEYSSGQKIGDFRIAGIGREKVILKDKNGAKFTLNSGEENAGTSKPEAVAKSSTVKPVQNHETLIKKIISREKVNRILSDQSKVFSGIAMGPVTKGKEITGYRIVRVRNNHFFYELGARSGDVVTRVNGQPFGEMSKMLKIWDDVKTADKIIIDLDRNGVSYTYELHIKN